MKQYPALDGLRGVSIILVLCVHLHLISPSASFLFMGGALGVDLFFVLSGFLITSILLDENEQTGRINLTNFYARRALRLFPALISVILFTCVVALIAGSFYALGITPLRFASVVGYFTNWVRAWDDSSVWILAHFWSLAVEEQFYLLWPIALIALLRFATRRTTLVIVIGGIGLSALWKVVLYLNGAETRRIVYGTDTRADVVLIGCLLALLCSWNRVPRWIYRANTLEAAVIILVAFFLVAGESFRPLYLGGFTLVAICAAIVIGNVVLVDSPVNRALQDSRLVWIGKRSYGLYLWHWPIYEVCQVLPAPFVVPCAICGSFLVAAFSFHFIESPFLRLKRRYSETKNLADPLHLLRPTPIHS